jgi:hypothetical protein
MPASLKIGAASLFFECWLIFSDHQKLGKTLATGADRLLWDIVEEFNG